MFLVVVVAGLVGGVVFLANWDIPSPSATVEKVIPNEQFPK